MNRRQIIIMSVVAGLLALGVLVLIAVTRKDAMKRMVPAWLNTVQPPDGIAAELPTVTEAESWAANRCRHMSASCSPYTAGRRVRRTYPASLAESDNSFIRASFDLKAGA